MQQAQSTIKKLPKFKRAQREKPALKLQPRDFEIIRVVYEHRFLNSDQINSLVDGSDQVILRRLQKLFHHGYLDRPPQQFSYAVSGNKKMIYGLGNKGADILVDEYGIDRGKINWRNKNYEVKDRHLQHTVMISNFRVALTLALKNTTNSQFLFWKQGSPGELRDYVMAEDGHGKRQRIPINPDAFFGLEDTNGKMFFFLEADRSTMTNPRFLQKMRGYFHYWRQGKHTEKYNIKNFRVLTITKSQQRADNLRQITKNADAKQKGFSAFWFTPAQNYSLDNPQAILNPIWQSPVNEHRHHLLE